MIKGNLIRNTAELEDGSKLLKGVSKKNYFL